MTKEQDKARARRRATRVETKRAQQSARTAHRRRLLAVLATVALVLAMVVGVTMTLGQGDPSATPSTGGTRTIAPSPQATVAPTAAGSGAAAAGLDCSTPPSPQATPSTWPSAPDAATAAGKTWVATIETNCGPITVELDGKAAPQTVASFLFLARQGYWAPSPCHRLTTSGIYVLQCGDPTGRGNGSPGYGYGVEHAPADGTYPRGTLAMARTKDPKSNGGQFFVVYKDTQLAPAGGGYSIFGRVTAGLDMVDRIAATGVDDFMGPGDGHPKTAISILKVSVTEKKA
ncbi:peptidylprolyl isomerase [Arsenicicoccus dermatophilus]|uniref:peptidylprolyl isomerase n=1 Tax=Arsenicicoccus dermatophilus TaxID=1076331 RepID=UPI0039172183